MMRANPYLYGPIVSGDRFFGRDTELQQLVARIVRAAEPASCSVVGETRIGKSSLLTKFVEIIGDQQPGLLILKYDVGAYFQAGRTADFYRQFISLIHTDLGRLPGLDHEAALRARDSATPWPVMVRSIEAFFRSIRETGRRVVIILDEFDFMTEHFKFDPQGWKLLRSLGYEVDHRVCYLTASRRSVEALERDAGISSNFAGIFGDPIRLGLMTEAETRQLVDRPAERAGFPWSEAQRRLTLQVAGYHPYCLQMTCFHLFDWREQGILPDDASEQWVIERLRSGFRSFFDLLRSRLERTGLFDVLLKIVYGVPSTTDAHQVEELVDLGYIIHREDKGDGFQPFSPALDCYLKAWGRTVELWPLMEQTELALRRLVETRYRVRFGDRWLDEIRKKNPGRPSQGDHPAMLGMVESWEYNRDKEDRNPFAVVDGSTNLIDFSYIGDLKQLIGQQWAQFQDIFPWRKRDLDERLDVLAHVRNPRAHYRRISDLGASKAEICCREILDAIRPHLTTTS